MWSKSNSGLPTWDVRERMEFLDGIYTELLDGQISESLSRLMEGLWHCRQSLPQRAWTDFARRTCRRHSLCELLQQDPMTSWSVQKPRGYPGDGVLLDFIYSGSYVPPQLCAASQIGQSIYGYLNDLPGAHAIRARLNQIAATIDRVAIEHNSASIWSVACGHLREADYSVALERRMVRRFLALDQDIRSLDVVNDSYSGLGINTVQRSVFELLKGNNDVGMFHLIYVVGLYDYLAQSAAQRLTEVLFDHLYPGGEILIANGLPDVPSSAYMEAYMDWHIVYRTVNQLEATAAGLRDHQLQERKVFTDQQNVFAFLTIKKRG